MLSSLHASVIFQMFDLAKIIPKMKKKCQQWICYSTAHIFHLACIWHRFQLFILHADKTLTSSIRRPGFYLVSRMEWSGGGVMRDEQDLGMEVP